MPYNTSLKELPSYVVLICTGTSNQTNAFLGAQRPASAHKTGRVIQSSFTARYVRENDSDTLFTVTEEHYVPFSEKLKSVVTSKCVVVREPF